ncbi:hypothetical protein ACTXG7_07505 [Mycolicibacterium sp. Dal123E01]|uniref:hypothetical protein n=1 Tax=Mycolicibacterium sp. Dal123E01 TaxID=3457578 RepID=UPI00403EAF87
MLLLTALLVTANRGLNISFERTKPHELAIATELVGKIGDHGLGYWGQGGVYGVPRTFELADSCFGSAEELATCTAQPEVEYFANTEQDENFIRLSVGLSPQTMQRALAIALFVVSGILLLLTSWRREHAVSSDGTRRPDRATAILMLVVESR